MRKKALSLFLAVCMVISLIPTTFAAIGTVYEYKFNPNGIEGSSSGTGTNLVRDMIATETNNKIQWVGAGAGEDTSITNGPYKAYMHKWGGICTNTTAVGQWLALKITISESGIYSASLLRSMTGMSSNGGYGHVYLLPGNTADIASELTSATPIGLDIAFCAETEDRDEPVGLSNITVKEDEVGEHILVFYASKMGAKYQMYPKALSLTKIAEAPATENEPLVDEFVKEEDKEDISYVEATVTGLTLNGKTISAEDNEDGTYNLTAPKTEKKFLYWAMGLVGNKRIVSFSETLENYVPEGNYRNYLVPVYEGDVKTTEKEFYNQNGQLIPDANESTLVSMPGYGSTSTWKQYGDTNIYVADYGKTAEQRDEVTVTAVGGTVNGNENAKVAFGTEVTCTATATDDDGNPFKCWKKTLDDETTEIVSIDSTYKFNAWETCTVTAVYEKHTSIDEAMKIIIDTFDVGSDTGIMAEFIGLDDAVEKGIMFTDSKENKTKIAMTTKENQFTVIADENGTYEGYAIVGNATDGYKRITDGSCTK